MAGNLDNRIQIRTDRDWLRFDASQTIELYASPIRLMWGTAAVLAMSGVAAWVLASDDTPLFVYLCAWAWVVAGPLVLGIILVRAITIRWPVITLSPDGFLDVRISSNAIPWNLIQEISDKTVARSSLRDSKALFLYLPKSSWKDIQLKRLVRWTLPLILSRKHGLEGVCIGHGEFGMSFDTLCAVVIHYAEARGVHANRSTR